MTISSETRTAGPYVCNGVTTVFAFTFKVFAASELLVVKYEVATELETSLTLNSAYTVQLNSDQNASPGGSITMTPAIASGFQLIITSKLPILQGLQIPNLGGFYPEVLNDAFDRITILLQQLGDEISRSVIISKFSDSTPQELIDLIRSSALSASNSASQATTQAGNALSSANAADVSEANALAYANSAAATVAGYLDQVHTFTKAQRGAVVPLTSTGASVAVDLALSNNFSHTTSENTTLAAPSNPVAGQSGIITITQGAAARTLAFNAFWKFAGGIGPTLTATIGAVDVFSYYVESASRATCNLVKDAK
jgi:hypothetical protein